MGLYEGRGALSKAYTMVDRAWLEARVNWNDARTREFEERFLIPLKTDLMGTVSAMDHAAALISRIRSECE